MSRESEAHVRLVQGAATEIARRHGELYSLTILVDLPSAGTNRPGPIGGYFPDVFAIDVPETCRIIGEAKTATDCETEHSRLQLRAFLTHLSRFPNGHCYLAVPLFYRIRAEQLLLEVARSVGACRVKLNVLGGI